MTDFTLVDLRVWELMIDYMEDMKDSEIWIVHTKRDLTVNEDLEEMTSMDQREPKANITVVRMVMVDLKDHKEEDF